jgi:hypothetical protein
MIEECLKDSHKDLVANYVNGKVNLARANKTMAELNHGKLAVEAEEAVTSSPTAFLCKGILKALRPRFKSAQGTSLQVGESSKLIGCDDLVQIAKKVKKPQKAK